METTGEVISAATADPAALQLGVSSQALVFDSRMEVRSLSLALATQAQRTLLLHTRDLEAVIFDQLPFLEAVQEMVRRHRDSCFHILLQDGRAAIRNSNRLIELSRRLSTRIEIRQPQAEHLDFPEAFLLADDTGYLHRPLYSRYEGTAGFNNPAMNLRLKRYFTEVWERSIPDVEMRRLYL